MFALVRRASPASRLAAATLLLLGLAGGVVLVAAQTESVTGLLDLRIYRGAAASLRASGSLYDFRDPTFGLGSTYPPFASLVFIVFTAGPVVVVEHAVTALNVTLWWGLMATMTGWATRRTPGRWDLAVASALALATMPSVAVWNTLNQGQINLVLWAMLVADVALVARRHPAAGVFTGVAAAVKLVPLLLLGVYGLARRPVVTARGLAAFAAATAVGAAVLPADSRRYWGSLLFDTGRVGSMGDPQNNSLRFVLDRVGLTGLPATALWLVLAAGVIALAVRAVQPALEEGALVTAATALGCASALVSPISWMHHLVFLAFPLVLLLPEPGMPRRPAIARVLAIGVALVLLADPLGANGRHPVTTGLRIATMVVILVLSSTLRRAELDRGRHPADAANAADSDPKSELVLATETPTAPASMPERRPGDDS